jgi:hypothetical protein
MSDKSGDSAKDTPAKATLKSKPSKDEKKVAKAPAFMVKNKLVKKVKSTNMHLPSSVKEKLVHKMESTPKAEVKAKTLKFIKQKEAAKAKAKKMTLFLNKKEEKLVNFVKKLSPKKK